MKNEKNEGFYMKINSDLKKEFNVKCIDSDLTMSEVITELIKEYIEK
jgi:hypothetical protein